MWVHIIILSSFCILFFCAGGFFTASGNYISDKLPEYSFLTKEQIRMFLMVLFWGNVLGTAVTAVYTVSGNETERFIKRQETSYAEEYYVTDGENREKIEVIVEKEPYTEAEKKRLLDTAVASLPVEILGENQNFDRIEYPLNLMTGITDTEITVEWTSDDPMILDWEGQIGEDVPEYGTSVSLQAELVLDDCRRVYEQEVMVFPQKKSERELFLSEIEEELDVQNKKQGEYLKLPVTVNGRILSWSKVNRFHGLFISAAAVLIGVLLVLSDRSRKKEFMEKRRQQMLDDYPGILNKLILLIQAGMSSRRAIQKIAVDYRRGLESGKPKRYAYEEFVQIYKEMEQGVSEETAYRNLAARNELLCYRSLSTLLVQNLKKGSNYFLTTLKTECSAAFEQRKKRALVRGEEAGTKLLIPMGGMLLIVLLIILVPSMMALG